MTTCRYLNNTRTTSTNNAPSVTVRHVCEWCSGKGQYKTSEIGKRKVRR